MVRYMDLKDEEKNKVILMITDYIITNQASVRQASEYAKSKDIQVSHITIYDDLKRLLPKLDKNKSLNIEKILI